MEDVRIIDFYFYEIGLKIILQIIVFGKQKKTGIAWVLYQHVHES